MLQQSAPTDARQRDLRQKQNAKIHTGQHPVCKIQRRNGTEQDRRTPQQSGTTRLLFIQAALPVAFGPLNQNFSGGKPDPCTAGYLRPLAEELGKSLLLIRPAFIAHGHLADQNNLSAPLTNHTQIAVGRPIHHHKRKIRGLAGDQHRCGARLHPHGGSRLGRNGCHRIAQRLPPVDQHKKGKQDHENLIHQNGSSCHVVLGKVSHRCINLQIQRFPCQQGRRGGGGQIAALRYLNVQIVVNAVGIVTAGKFRDGFKGGGHLHLYGELFNICRFDPAQQPDDKLLHITVGVYRIAHRIAQAQIHGGGQAIFAGDVQNLLAALPLYPAGIPLHPDAGNIRPKGDGKTGHGIVQLRPKGDAHQSRAILIYIQGNLHGLHTGISSGRNGNAQSKHAHKEKEQNSQFFHEGFTSFA